MTKQGEINNKNSCFNKAASNEPIFVLRAQDKISPILVRAWAQIARLNGCPEDKIQSALKCAGDMESWADFICNGGKLPD